MAHTENYITQAAGDARYQQLGSLSNTEPEVLNPDDTSVAGVSTAASRSDHVHGIPAADPVAVGLAGTNSEGAGTAFARNNHVHAYTPPACRVYHNVNQNINASTETVVAFNSERYDTDTMHDTAVNNSRITLRTAGLYVVNFAAEWAAGAGHWTTYGVFYLNGVTPISIQRVSGANAGSTALNLTTIYKFAANDYVETRVWQNSGVLALVSGGNYSPEFSATWIGVG